MSKWLRIACIGIAALCVSAAPNVVHGQTKTEKKISARLRVLLPKETKLYVNGSLTKSTGGKREFVSPPIQPGKTFKYTLKAVFPDGGFDVTRMAVAKVKAGQLTVVDMHQDAKDGTSSQIIFVPTHQKIVDKMVEIAKVTKTDVVFDLGCGDGRIVVTAAKKHGARGIGVDIDPERVKESLAKVKKNKVEKLVAIRHGDALKVKDISKASVVMLYMLPEFQKQLAPILKRDLKAGTRVVSHDYALPGWEPERVVSVRGPFRMHVLYLYVAGKGK